MEFFFKETKAGRLHESNSTININRINLKGKKGQRYKKKKKKEEEENRKKKKGVLEDITGQYMLTVMESLNMCFIYETLK